MKEICLSFQQEMYSKKCTSALRPKGCLLEYSGCEHQLRARTLYILWNILDCETCRDPIYSKRIARISCLGQTGAQLWEIPPVRGGFVPRGKANSQAAPPTGNSYGILPPVRADRPVPNVADLPNVGSNAS